MSHYQQGQRAFDALCKSPNYAFVQLPLPAESAIKLFLPPVNELMSMLATPYPKDRQEWMDGFNDRQTEYLKEGKDNADS